MFRTRFHDCVSFASVPYATANGVRLYYEERGGGRTVETRVAAIFTKLDLLPTADDHPRVLAVIEFLRSPDPRA
jgi:hypothetical protein